MSAPRPKRSTKLASWVCCAISLAGLAGCVRDDETFQPSTAEVVSAESGETTLMSAASALPPSDAYAVQVQFPYVRDLRKLPPAEREVGVRLWLTIRFDDPRRDKVDSLLFYVPRLGANERQWILNGVPIVNSPTGPTSTWNTPELLLLPNNHLHDTGNELTVVLDTIGGALTMMRPRVGPRMQIEWRYRLRTFLQIDAVRGISALFAVLGAFSLWFWLRRRREYSYVLFTVTALAWIVRLSQYYYDEASFWFSWVAVNSLMWAITCTYLFALSLSGSRAGWLGRLLIGIALTVTLLSSPAVGAFGDIWIASPWINLFAVALSVVLGIQLTSIGYRDRHRSIYALTFAGALWISLAFGVHDLLMQLNVISQAGIYLLPYGALLQVLTFASGVYWRLASTVGEVEQLNRELGERVKATEERLHKAYGELSALEKQRAVDDERQRLMREMHDGLGSSLMTSLAMAERGSVDQATMTEALRECLQQLQLTVDSLEPMGGDLATVLGTLRYRLGARLEAAGLRVHWQAAALPALTWLDAHAALHVLRIVQEVLTNILKHSGATDITLATEADGESVRVRVIDNGRGFDVASHMLHTGRTAGHGLVNIERRAQQLRGRTRIESGPQGTAFELILPID